MKDFQYTAPNTVENATRLLSEHGSRAKILAGGTDIIVQLREGMCEADVVVDIKKIPELVQYQYASDSGLTLGAAVSCCNLYEDSQLADLYGALADSSRIIGGWQIQSRASVGGNLCNASPAADCIPALIALNATAHITGPDGERQVAVEDFCISPGTNILDDGEFLISLHIPAQSANMASAYERFIPRNEMDIAVVGVGSWVSLDDAGRITAARISLGAVAATPLFAAAASDHLIGKEPTEENFAQAGELAQQIATPITDMRGTAAYRTHLVAVLVKRTLTTAVQRATA
ncbi:MAG: xanthine dehydrogenase family protein subunit M [Planctomycetota bacterium]|nr:xanthine dehydrogenase family protein subunit M [Planctomycetota bacterium]